jgi:hypothetical protein
VVEYVSPLLGSSLGSVRRSLVDKAGDRQAAYLVIDVSSLARPISRGEALWTIARNGDKLAKAFTFVRVIGAGFDFTVHLPLPPQ